MRSVGFCIIVGLASAPAVASAAPTEFASEAYLDCARTQAEGNLPSGNLRYGDDLFASSYNNCAEKLPKPEHVEGWPDAMYRSTAIYMETLRFLNALPRPNISSKSAKFSKADPSFSAPATPSLPNGALEEIDSMTSRDFSILYMPWIRCLSASMQGDNMKQPSQSLTTAVDQCKKVSDLADIEALNTLNGDGHYGTADNQKTVLNEFKLIAAQLATLGAMRANGENLGSALKRSAEATQDAPNQ